VGKGARNSKSCVKILLGLLLLVLLATSVTLLWFSSHRALALHRATVVEDEAAWLQGDSRPAKKKDSSKVVHKADDEHGKNFHIVFSTGCNAFQDCEFLWRLGSKHLENIRMLVVGLTLSVVTTLLLRTGQSYVFFYQVYQSGQKGDVTRVASGCTPEDAETLTAVFRDQIQTMLPVGDDRFHLHLTPDFSKTAGYDYKFFNKPFGLTHWMKHGLGFPDTLRDYKDTIIIVLDPDQFLLRPFQADYSHDTSVVWHEAPEDETFVVREGRPFGQFYSFGAAFVPKANRDIPRIVQAALNATSPPTKMDPKDPKSSHLYRWTAKEVVRSYAAGPPYIAVASDMFQIVTTWASIAVPVFQLTDEGHLSEMFAYSIAAAHLNLPHQLAYSFMVSSPQVSRQEGWNVIDEAKPEEVCMHVRSDKMDPARVAWASTLPQVLHYCQRYFLGPWFFSKYKLPKDFLSCGQPLLKDPLDHDGVHFVSMYNSSVTPNHQFNQISPRDVKRHAFALCYTISIMNEAVQYWKEHHCRAEDNANYSKTFLFPFDRIK